MQMVCVQWDDITESSEWSTVEALGNHRPARIETVGWVLEDTKKTLKLCTSRDQDEPSVIGGVIVIPKGVIRSVSRLATA